MLLVKSLLFEIRIPGGMSSRLQLQNFLNVVHLNETRICGRIFSKTSWKSENVVIRTESGSSKLTFSWVIRYSSVKILYLAEFIKFFHFVIEINFFLYNFFLTSIEFKRFSDFEACILKIVAEDLWPKYNPKSAVIYNGE